MDSLSRRRFLQSSMAAAALVHTGDRLAKAAFRPASTATEREPLRELAYREVQLTGGPFKEHYDRVHAQYLALSDNSLLKVYRQRAGLPAPGADMGGWYDLDGFVPGHTLGQYISGLARIGASTGDAACMDKVRTLVTGFGATLGSSNESILRPKTNLWTCYTLDKHFAGLLDAYTLTNVGESRELLNRVLAGAQPLLPAAGHDRIGKAKPPYDETFVMPENLFLAAEVTGNPAFRTLAEKYLLDRELFDPLARGEDPFPGQHAYSHAIAMSSAGRAYLVLGDAKYRQAMRQAFALLTTQQQFASGGWGPNETFIRPHRGELYESLKTTVDHFETPCGAYAATKLARYLLRTGEPQSSEYGDNLERVLFNTILASRDPDSSGDFFYYSTYSPAASKVYYPKKWPCCSGTLVQTVADYPLNIYFTAADAAKPALYVNLYTPSTAQTALSGVPIKIAQDTLYPVEDTVRLMLDPAHPVRFTLRLRLPSWLQRPAIVAVNGKAVEGKTATGTSGGSFLTISRVWRTGDLVSLTLPQDFRTEAIDELHPGTVALMRGPVQYVALHAEPDTAEAGCPLPANLKPIGKGTTAYTATQGGQEIVYVPLYTVRSETYTTYFTRA